LAETTVPQPNETAAPSERTRSEETYLSPTVDIYEDEQGLHVMADLPGVNPDGVDVRVEKGVLTIQAQAQHLLTTEPVHREYALTGFFRQFQLPEEVDTTRIAAQLRNGVLTLDLPRMEAAQPRRIEVRAT
jgi:HSP20 family protein